MVPEIPSRSMISLAASALATITACPELWPSPWPGDPSASGSRYASPGFWEAFGIPSMSLPMISLALGGSLVGPDRTEGLEFLPRQRRGKEQGEQGGEQSAHHGKPRSGGAGRPGPPGGRFYRRSSGRDPRPHC